jgi:hypothetical protein
MMEVELRQLHADSSNEIVAQVDVVVACGSCAGALLMIDAGGDVDVNSIHSLNLGRRGTFRSRRGVSIIDV